MCWLGLGEARVKLEHVEMGAEGLCELDGEGGACVRELWLDMPKAARLMDL